MKNLFKILFDVTIEAFCNFTYFIKNNLITFANILSVTLPYIMYILGQMFAIERKELSVGIEIIIPVVFIISIYYLKSIANKLGKGTTIPVPSKRFTQVEKDGEVSIEDKRLQELILYIADLEDWAERKGLL